MESPGDEANSAIASAADGKFITINELITQCVSNAEYYEADKTFVGVKLHASFRKVADFLGKSEPVVKEIENFAGFYDFDEVTPGNGYRSFLYIFECAVKHTEKICKYITDNRGYLLFRKSVYMKEIEVCSEIFESVFMIMENLLKMHRNSSDGNLYSREYSHDNLITRNSKVISQVCFYGRAIGFQYCDSMKPILRFLAVSMASFSESYFSTGYRLLKSTNSLFSSSRYFLDPEYCAQRIVSVSHNAEIDFCKSYWFLAEGKLMHTIPSLVGYKVDVSKTFKISPELLQIYSETSKDFVDIPIPHSHTGVGPVSCRLISAKKRRGMVGEKSFLTTLAEPSKYLIFHTHGGGWVAQSSKSHELYLREWAVKLDVPIISIDYSLAPEAPFPRGFEDVFFAYCWVLKNIGLLGSTGENIVFAGDSAGGNLNTACVVKCIEMGIPLPKGLFNAYTPFLVNFASSPARFLSYVDPLLPYGFIMRVFKSYGAVTLNPPYEETKINHSNKENEHKVIEDVRDDNDDSLLSPDTSRSLDAMWNKIQTETEQHHWQTNLGSIQEVPSEPTTPFPEGDEKDGYFGLDMRSPERQSSVQSGSYSRNISIENEIESDKNEVRESESSSNEPPKRAKEFAENFASSIPSAPEDEFVFSVPVNQYLSPYWASEEVLKKFPSTKVLSTNVDPCLDDCVEFSKKLKKLGVDVSFEVLDGVNHGFLNFAQVSKESHDASMSCMKRISELLGLEGDENS